MTSERPAEKDARSRRVYAYWTVALGLLAALGLFCWTFAYPVLCVRGVVRSVGKTALSEEEIVDRLGGPKKGL